MLRGPIHPSGPRNDLGSSRDCQNHPVASSQRIGRLAAPAAIGLLAGMLGILAGINPQFAIAAALGLAFLLIVVGDLYVGVILFTLLNFVAELPNLAGQGVTGVKMAGLLLAVAWLVVILTQEDARGDFASAFPAAAYGLLLFLAWIAVSQVWAEDPGLTVDSLFRLSLNATLLLIIFTAIRTPRQVLGLAGAFVAGATINAVYGLLFVAPAGEEAARLASGITNPNELATVLVAALVMSLGLAAALRGSPASRFALIGAGVICTAGVFLTGSRGGLVALAIALAAFLLIGRRFRGRILIVAVVVAAAAYGYYDYVASPETRARLTQDVETDGRTDLWQIAWRMVESEPVRGVGGGNYPATSADYLFEPGAIDRTDLIIGQRAFPVHNTYLEIWAELGTVGLALFMFVIGFGIYAAAKAARAFARLGDMPMEMMARAVMVALAAVIAADFFGSRQYNRELWILLGLAPAIWAMAKARLAAESADPAARIA